MQRWFFSTVFLAACSSALLLGTWTAPAGDPPFNPKISGPSDEAKKALKRLKLPTGVEAELWAAEPLLANPVAFCFDEKGRAYVAETFRLHAGVSDNRNMAVWLKDDLASRTVADRIAMYKKHLGKKFADWEKAHDRVRMLEDTKGAGVADKATVFADGFRNAEDGLGSGVLAHHGKVYYTCIPDLWLLQDTKGESKADLKKSLHSGFGVHVAFLGHDMHGLKIGPDGRLYFSIGDRGLHVSDRVSSPDTGAVLRCELDGSKLEIVATGLRNPQELAFDQYGNLFTGDNNADSGDQARWVHVVEGGDSGWRIGYQYLKTPPAALGPWNAEKLWHTQHPGQAAYILPPLTHLASGPSGLTYHPGVALLPERYKEHFFLCDFRGGSGGSGVHSFAVKPKGATFEVVDRSQFAWNILATDCDFSPDGGFYISDWTEGWGLPGKGRLVKLVDPSRKQDKLVAETKQLLAEGFGQRDAGELEKLLGHADMRIRQEAQFALANRDTRGVPVFARIAASSEQQLARLHAVWGLGQVARRYTDPDIANALPALLPLLKDKDAEVRAQAARMLGEAKYPASVEKLLPLLKDSEPRVRLCAAMSLGKQGDGKAVEPLLEMLRANADQDVYLRHAGVQALTTLGDRQALLAHARDGSAAARLGVLLAMRRLAMPEVAQYLDDTEPRLIAEAARAINDVPIDAALPKLAQLGTRTGLSEPVLYRVLNAHLRLGQVENAQALARFAARHDVPEPLRVTALSYLSDWSQPVKLDRVVGLWRPTTPRAEKAAEPALRGSLGALLASADKVRTETIKVAGKYGIKEMGPTLLTMVQDSSAASSVRIESLKALEALKDAKLGDAIQQAVAGKDARLRAEARAALARREGDKALPALEQALTDGETIEKQSALTALASVPGAAPTLRAWLDKLAEGKLPLELQLEVLEAAGKRSEAEIKERLQAYEKAQPRKDLMAQYREALHGGDAENGRKIFLERSEVSCVRCHKLNGIGGDVGPELNGIGKREKRDYLLESLVLPDKIIAKGFAPITLLLTDGKVVTGILKADEPKQVRLMTAEGALLTIPVERIEERTRGKSAMPEDLLQRLTRREVRDLVEFLSSLQ